jgi:hypothetical protein
MRGVVAGWAVFFGPLLALVSAELLYRGVGVTGGALFVGALAIESAAGLILLRAGRLTYSRALAVAVSAAALTGALFLLWAAAAHNGL